MRSFLATLLAAVVFFPLTANATDVEGDVWGTWTRENSPYNVIGEVRVPPGSTLVIEPGILVDFKGHYKFIVDSLATLLAVGTEQDSIYFTCDTLANPDRWHGIRFIYADSNSQISYCRLEYGRAGFSGNDSNGGAIWCFWSSPTISNNTIRRSRARFGGGISCVFSSPTISNNTLIENKTNWKGAAIYCVSSYSAPIIKDNVITGNSATGGTICCSQHSRPTITGNLIVDNTAFTGGGIHCGSVGRPTISGNVIRGNTSTHGGGVYCDYYANPEIANNTISGNSASGQGGGICCIDSSDAIICSNTISGNSASYGGGIYCFDCRPEIKNTIFWGDEAPSGSEIYLDSSADPTFTYCDIQGGWAGEGNINADPLFVDPEGGDFHLRCGSPCIDAGDPESPFDPDSSRADIGAFFFNHVVQVTITPKNPPIIIPPEGRTFRFKATITNITDTAMTIDVWTMANVPESGYYGPLKKRTLALLPHQSLNHPNLKQNVPAYAPAGVYHLIAYVGDYTSCKIDSSLFAFFKTGKAAAGKWSVDDWFEESLELNLPMTTLLLDNHPNPFNTSTTINYQLASTGEVKVEVYNLLGQKVATLLDGRQEAGYRSVIWAASEVSSGIYFYRLTAGDFTETKRMMLVK